MKRTLKILLFFISVVLLVSGCRKKEFDEYYGRPDWLADPIYQQLTAHKNFTNLLSVIDKAGYKDILSKSGYWTMFAPNDAAFQKFFKEKGISGIEAVDSTLAQKIVKYALVYNAFKTDHIADYQSSAGWMPNLAYKRRTAYYDGFYKETVNGKEMVVIASNRNNDAAGNFYVPGDNNNKYVPYFHDKFIQAQNLSASDYNYFYPNQSYTGFNFIGGKVEQADIIAENGVIHEVSEVSLPLPNFDQYLAANPQYSLFKSILDKYLVQYIKNESATKTYQILTGKSDDVYVKVYDPALAFSPNNENYLKQMDNDGQSDGYSMFVPTNEVLQKFIDDVLLENYTSLDQLPKYVLVDFINAHMWQNTVWPSKFKASINFLQEEARFNNTTDIVDKKILSNGIFYGTNKVQASNVFYTVYTKPYLDPKYTLMTRALNEGDGYKGIISNPNRKFTLFMMSDDVLKSLGYSYNITRSEWNYMSPDSNVIAGSLAKSRLLRILYNHIVLTPAGELNNLSGSGIIRSGDRDIAGEYIKYDNNKVFAAGNEDLGNVVNITGYKDVPNGRVYYTDNILQFSEQFVGKQLKKLADESGSEFSNFYKYLEHSSLYDKTAGSIKGVSLGTSYTFLIPDNAAILAAVNDGVLPGTGTAPAKVPNFAPTTLVEQDMVTKFLQYHILAKKTIGADGLETGPVETLFKNELGDVVFVNAINVPGLLKFEDANFRTVNIIPAQSNHLADRALIHLIDNYLLYKD